MNPSYWQVGNLKQVLLSYIKNRSIWHLKRKRLWTAFSILFSLLTLTVVLNLYLSSLLVSHYKTQFDTTCKEISQKIKIRLADYSIVSRGLASLFNISNNITRDDWHEAYLDQKIDSKFLGFQGIAYNEIIQPNLLVEHENKIRKQGFANYAIKPKGRRNFYTSIVLIEPFTGKNVTAFGFDTYTEPLRRQAMCAARDNNYATLTKKIKLVQESNRDVQPGIILFTPVYKKGLQIETVEQRRHAIQGWISVPIRMIDFMVGVLSEDNFEIPLDVSFKIYDAPNYNLNNLLFSSSKQKVNNSNTSFKTNSVISYNKNNWYIEYKSQNSSLASITNTMTSLILIGGTFISFTLFLLYISVVSMNNRAAALADKLTIDLSKSEEKFKKLFLNEVYAIAIFDFSTSAFIDVNNKYCSLYGYSKDEFLTSLNIYDITSQSGETRKSINEAAENGHIYIPIRYHKKKDGTVFPVEIVAETYFLGDRKVVYAVAHDITDRINLENALHENRLFLANVIHGTNVGTWKWNIQTGETEFSERWAEIIGYTLDELKPITINTWIELCHPDDLVKSNNMLNKVFQKEIDFYAIDVRIKHKNGSWVWVYDSGKVIEWTTDNKPVIMVGTHLDITDRKLLAIKLAESENKFRNIFENNIAVMLIIDPYSGKIINANTAAAYFYGYSIEHLKQMHIHEINTLSKDEIAVHRQKAKSGENKFNIFPHRVSNGEIKIVEVYTTTIEIQNEELLVSIIHDITARIEAEKANAKWKLIFNESKLGLAVSTEDGMHINLVNEECARMHGYEVDELTNVSIMTLIADCKRKDFYEAYSSFNESGHFIGESRHIRKNGSEFPALIDATLIKEAASKSSYRIVNIHDITKLKESEAELLNYQEHLEELVKQKTSDVASTNQQLQLEIQKQKEYEILLKASLDKEKELNMMKSNFIATSSHEFRTPLAAILSSIELLNKYGYKWSQEKKDEHVERIRSKVDYLTDILDDILLISRSEAGKINCNKTKADLRLILENCINDIEFQLNCTHNFTFTYSCESNIFHVDSSLIKTIITNLISNAVKFSPEGGRVELNCSQNEDVLEISVSDEGIGVPANEVENIFESFFRASNVEALPGTGLGLAIAENSAKLHGGKIIAQSELGKGSTFTVILPIN